LIAYNFNLCSLCASATCEQTHFARLHVGVLLTKSASCMMLLQKHI